MIRSVKTQSIRYLPRYPRWRIDERTVVGMLDKLDPLFAEQAKLDEFFAHRAEQDQRLLAPYFTPDQKRPPQAAPAPVEYKPQAFNFSGLLFCLTPTIKTMTTDVMAMWEEKADSAPKAATMARLITRLNRLTKLVNKTILAGSYYKAASALNSEYEMYLADSTREFEQRFIETPAMDKACSQLYKFIALACKICQPHSTTLDESLVSRAAINLFRSVFLAPNVKKGLLVRLQSHNKILEEKYQEADSTLDAKKLEFMAFIMDSYITRLYPYLNLYTETFAKKNPNGNIDTKALAADENYQEMLACFEKLVTNTANLYLKYAELRRTKPELCSEAETAAKHSARLVQYQGFYSQVIRPHIHGDNPLHRTATDKALGKALVEAQKAEYARKLRLVAAAQQQASASAASARSAQPQAAGKYRDLRPVGASSQTLLSALNDKTGLAATDGLGEDLEDLESVKSYVSESNAETSQAAAGVDENSDDQFEDGREYTPKGRPLWQRILALLAVDILIAAIGVVVIAAVAPQLLALPVLATILSYGTLGTVGGIIAGTVAAGVALTLAALFIWGVAYSTNKASEQELKQVAALFIVCLLISAISVAVISAVAPELLALPLLASILSYGALGTPGGLVSGVLLLSITLFLLALGTWIIIDMIQAYRASSQQKAVAELDKGLLEMTKVRDVASRHELEAPAARPQPVLHGQAETVVADAPAEANGLASPSAAV